MSRIKKGLLGSNKITQIGMVVRNIDETAKNYAEIFGVDVPKVRETASYGETLAEYNGEPTTARAKLAFFKFKNITLELIEPIDGPSTWQNFLDKHGEGVHHIAFNIKGTIQKINLLSEKGVKLEQKGNYPGGHYAYVNSQDKLKIILELLENDLKKI